MTSIYQKNNHFHIFTGEIWDLESMQDAMRDVIAPYSVSKGECNIILDLSQLSNRHIYNKSFILSVKRFVDNIYGVKIIALVIPDPNNLKRSNEILDNIIKVSTSKTAHWVVTGSYQLAQIEINRGQ